MRLARAYIIIGIFGLLLASCGQQHKSQSLADDFIDDYMISPDKVESKDYSKLDSTKLITDSAIQAMRKSDGLKKVFKSGIDYTGDRVGKKLYRLRLSYKMDGEEKSMTFYLDENLDGVVGVKND